LFHKNFGIYDSVQKIPFLLSYPGGPKGLATGEIVESIDFYPSICQLCGIPVPEECEGRSIIPIIEETGKGKEAAYCEWSWGNSRIAAVRTRDYRLVVYQDDVEGELYDHRMDPGEINNLWNSAEYKDIKTLLMQKLLQFSMNYSVKTSLKTDDLLRYKDRYTPAMLVQFGKIYWSRLKDAYSQEGIWPPESCNYNSEERE
jgi:arylsulfatase A-like enzyme